MQQHHNEHFPVELSSQLVSIITTEHYNLQTGRSMTTAETNGRASLFVGAVSSELIALTFVGQISHLGTAFFVFSLVVIPTLVFMGLITFEAQQVVGAVALRQLAGIGLGRVRGIGREAEARQIHLGKMRGHRSLLIGILWDGHLLDQSLVTGDEVDQRQGLVGFGLLQLNGNFSFHVLRFGTRRGRFSVFEDLAVQM